MCLAFGPFSGITGGCRVRSCSSWRPRSRWPWSRSSTCSGAGERTTTVSQHPFDLHKTAHSFTSLPLNPLCHVPECTFIVLDKQRWAAGGVDEEQCMVGDVNIFLTDPAEPSLAELEVMIAGNNLLILQLVESFVISWTFFYVFSEPNYRGKGIGTEVARMMMLYGNYC